MVKGQRTGQREAKNPQTLSLDFGKQPIAEPEHGWGKGSHRGRTGGGVMTAHAFAWTTRGTASLDTGVRSGLQSKWATFPIWKMLFS